MGAATVGVGVDGTNVRTLAEAGARALELVADAVLILDPAGIVVLANPAAERLSGAAPGRLLDRDARSILGALPQESADGGIWSVLAAGDEWRGPVVAHAADGTHAAQSAILSAVRDASGLVTGYVAVLTERVDTALLDEERSRWAADRAGVLAIMGEVRSFSTIEQAATALCEAISGMDDIDGAIIMLIPAVGDLVIVSNAGESAPGFDFGSRIPVESLEMLTAVTAASPWVLDLMRPAARDLVGSDLVDSLRGLGLTATAYSVIRSEGAVIGVLSIASMQADGADRLARRLGSLEQLGGLAGAVLGSQAVRFQQDETLRNVVRDILANTRFRPVFQPIVRIEDGVVVGYEALTRFDDGTPPDQRIISAHAVGMGIELEEACVRRAVELARDLPPGCFLSVNFSPSAIVSGSLSRTLAGVDRELVVEITENALIDSYEEIRRSLAAHPGIAVAVDDAGAGFASLQHILEIGPAFVKLDIGLVRHVDSNPARAAMVAGVCHFAQETGTRLIAEGVETRSEAEALRGMHVELAQGYLFGRPSPTIRQGTGAHGS